MSRAALIGVGMVAGTYASAIRASAQVSLAAVAARRVANAEGFVAAHPDLGAQVATVEDIAADPTIDFAIVTTPPNARQEIVEILSAAGKPILMEKPLERGIAAATALVETCKARDVPLGVMLQHRARPIVADLRRVLPDLGALHMVEVNIPWWRPQAYYDEPGRGTYSRDGGGVLISQAIHTLDLMLSLTGPVSRLSAMSATTGFHQMEAEDMVCAGLKFANGAVGQLFATTASFPGRGETITLHCAKGSAHLEAGELRMSYQDGTQEILGAAAASGAGADPMAFTSDWHQTVIEDFADSLKKGQPPLIPAQEALGVHSLITALETSASEGREVSV